MPFIEALTQRMYPISRRQHHQCVPKLTFRIVRHETGTGKFMSIHVSYVPTVHGEQKTKPTQHAVKSIRSYGLMPDVVACRCETPLAEPTLAKLALHCQVETE